MEDILDGHENLWTLLGNFPIYTRSIRVLLVTQTINLLTKSSFEPISVFVQFGSLLFLLKAKSTLSMKTKDASQQG